MESEHLVRLGRVTAVDKEHFTAQVWFPDRGFGSDWMPVLRSAPLPKVHDQVLVLFLPVDQGDGIILGEVAPWR